MNSRQAKTQTMNWMRENSGLEQHRHYLGMSQIDRCSRWLYESFLNGRAGREMSDAACLRCYSGNLFHRDAMQVLIGAGIAKAEPPTPSPFRETAPLTREIIAPFDERFRGHTDGESVDGWLIELKSMTVRDFDDLVRRPRLDNAYFVQVQAYMRYGDYADALVVAVCRETFDFWFIELRRDEATGERLEAKARMILRAIDERRPPLCTCGHCKREMTERETRGKILRGASATQVFAE